MQNVVLLSPNITFVPGSMTYCHEKNNFICSFLVGNIGSQTITPSTRSYQVMPTPLPNTDKNRSNIPSLNIPPENASFAELPTNKTYLMTPALTQTNQHTILNTMSFLSFFFSFFLFVLQSCCFFFMRKQKYDRYVKQSKKNI